MYRDIISRDNESYRSPLARHASAKVVAAQHDIEDPDWQDARDNWTDNGDENSDIDDGTDDDGGSMFVASTKRAKKPRQQTPSAQSKKKGQPQLDIELVLEFMREVEKRRDEREQRRLVMEEEKHALYRRERELELRCRELELQSRELELRGRGLEMQEREVKMAQERKKLQE
ncbi:hypothetical protein BGZ80_001556 [Entomortierella chlamydospora]|uniref:Uncharacterized protein n=1 Tax=Entomortierella chlamydospora TaxID=101097 RepID=A0A9P6MRI5_9FUNG|nr:hypothetical protein BGZ80_001556 [Entomortierella chlamydospora]